jgi:preprotein translocase subunit SecE
MARDRQRAKQRKARRAAQNPGPAPSEPHRANVPGELDHSSGEVDEFEAALVAGAGGEPVDADADDDVSVRAEIDAEDEAGEPFGDEGAVYDDELDDEEAFDEDDEVADDDRAAVATRGSDRPAARGRGARPARAGATAPGAATRSGPGRLVAFLQASWAELQRVQWPDRRQVFQATAVVLGFVVVAGLYLGIADRVAQEVVDLII